MRFSLISVVEVAAAISIALAAFCSTGLADDTQIHADNCGIAAGRDANGNTITCNYGLTPGQLRELTRAAIAGATGPLMDRIETLSKRIGASEAATKMLLKEIGERPDAPDEDLMKVLTEFAVKYKNLQAQVASVSGDNPVARALVTQVQNEIAAGRLQSAGELLQKLTRQVATLNGTCTKAEAMGVSVDPKFCLPQIMNTEYRDDRNAFTFLTQKEKGAAVISFSGPGQDQIHPSPDDAIQPIDKVVFTFQRASDYLKADGTCSFSNPYKGNPSTVSCRARTSKGMFSGEFISNGVAPNLFEAGAGVPAQRSTFSKPQILNGHCDPSSHLAEGHIGEDLTKRQSQFFCDAAVIVEFGDDPKHRLIQFADSRSNHGRIIGFSGLMEDHAMMTVRNVYLEIGRATAASDGACKFFFEKQLISGIACGAKIDEGDHRTVPVVAFVVDRTAKDSSAK